MRLGSIRGIMENVIITYQQEVERGGITDFGGGDFTSLY